MNKSLIIFLFVLISACSSNESKTESELTRFEQLFPHFPEQEFMTIELGEEPEIVQEKLKLEGFNLKIDQHNHYLNEELEAEIVLPELGGTNEFKVFLYAEEDLKFAEEYKAKFSEMAKSESISADFSIFEFETPTKEFTITLFQQSDFLRLRFELKTTH